MVVFNYCKAQNTSLLWLGNLAKGERVMSNSEFSDDFLMGQKACIAGEFCPVNVSDAFERGYAAQYEIEQVAEHNPQLAKQMKKDVIK